ncbi:MAG: stage V sporulation protein AB [Eubacteriales bacterium]|nr:stage V sporulation protein AB [Eubacteriales bacterium]
MGSFLSGLTGLSAGLISGAALCAFYIALGVFSKSAISLGVKNTGKAIAVCSAAGSVAGTLITLFDVHLKMSCYWPGVFGLFAGVYVGIFIACLAEVTNSVPVIRNLGISGKYITLILTVFVAGKLAGSILYWLSDKFF